MTEKERLHYFDIAKGIIILATVLFHVGGVTADSCNSIFMQMRFSIALFISPFFMPMYFMIRGYYYKKELSFVNEAKSSAIRLLFPMVLLFYWTEMWFCWAMFFAILIHHQLKRVKNIWFQSAIYFVMPFVGCYMAHRGYNWHYFGFALMTTPFLFIGEKCRWLLEKKISVVVCSLLYLCGMLFYFYRFGLHYEISSVPFLTGITYPSSKWIPFYIIMGICGTVLIVAFARFIGRNKYLEYVGRNSLIYFLFHFTAINLCNLCFWKYLQGLQTPDTYAISIAIYIFIFVISVALSTVVSILINRYCPWVIGRGL